MPDILPNAQLAVQINATGYPPPAITQWRKNGQSISGAGTGDLSFDPTAQPGSYSLTATFPNVVTPPPTWDSTPIAIVIIGDSTSGDQGFGDPPASMPAEMLAFSGRVLTIVANCYANGTTTRDWSDTSAGSLLSAALAKAKFGNATHVTVALGPNDCSVNHAITAIEFKANLIIICQAILANGQKAILHYGLIPLVSASVNTWTQASVDLGLSYRPVIDSLIDGKTILQGDTKLADYLRANPATYQGGTVQESPLVGGFHQWATGVQHSGRMWAEGCEFAVTPAARTLGSTWALPPLVNPDKSINWANRANHWNLTDQDSVSKRIGGHKKKFHPGNPPDTRQVLWQYPDRTEPLVRTKFGTGDTITIDGDLGNPGHNLVTQPAAQEVIPYNIGDRPGVDPGVNNLKSSLPNEAVDVLDPLNNPSGYVTTTGDVTREDYLKDPTKYTIVSGKGDGFTPPETFLKAQRQQWIDQGNGKWSKLTGGNYWSVRGQALSVPSDPTVSPIQAVQFGAYYNLVIRTSPKGGGTPWGPVTSMFNISSIYVSDKIVCGEALAVDTRLRQLTSIPAPTSRDGDAGAPPVYQFPEGEIPIFVTSSDMNELALVLVWTSKGAKAVVIALQGYALKNHSQPWAGFSNLGSFSRFQLVGEQELPFFCPTIGKIGTNAALAPQPDPGSINLSDPGQRAAYSNLGDPGRYMCFPNKAWFAVASNEEGEFIFYDFTPWMLAVWTAYMEPDQTKWLATAAAHAAGTFPPLFTADPSYAPTVVLALPMEKPTCMISSGYGGPEIGFNWSDFQKLAIGLEDGTVRFINISWYVDTFNWTGFNPPGEAWTKPDNLSLSGSIWVGRGLVHLFWGKFSIPNAEIHYLNVMNAVTTDHRDQDANGYANAFYAVCRGDNETKLIISHFDLANIRQVSGTHLILNSSEQKDCVAGAMQDRFSLVDVADFDGEAIHVYQKGYIGRGPEPDDQGNANAYPGFGANPDSRDPTKLLGYAGKFKTNGPATGVANNNGN